MQLRPTSVRRCVHIGLAVVVAALALSPVALAVAEKPKPGALWNAFPLDPASKRPASPLLPPAQERAEARAEATTVTAQPSEGSRENLLVLAFATLIVLVSTVVVFSGRRLYVRRHHRSSSVPLWQGVAWPHYPNNVRELRSGTRTSSALVGPQRRAPETLPDVSAPRYRWADKSRARQSRQSMGAEISTLLYRLRRTVWTEDTVPAIIGAGVAVVFGVLLVYLIG